MSDEQTTPNNQRETPLQENERLYAQTARDATYYCGSASDATGYSDDDEATSDQPHVRVTGFSAAPVVS